MKSIFRLSFFVVLFALLTVGAAAQTPCAEGNHYTKTFIIQNGKPYHVLTFTNTSECQWLAPAGATNLEYLVVAGGGSGGTAQSNSGCGGGGAGGFLEGTTTASRGKDFRILVGAGGIAPAYNSGGSTTGNSGSNSYIKTVVSSTTSTLANAIGGGGGGKYMQTGGSGGSSGGSGGNLGGISTVAVATAGQGNVGGLPRSSQPNRHAGGGGGGAGGAGLNGDPLGNGSTRGGTGGVGKESTITGESVLYAGGGGGGAWDSNSGASEWGGDAGTGGGGAGSTNTAASAGTDGLGGGGGGAGDGALGGNGGRGTVIIRYGDKISLSPTQTAGAGIVKESTGLFITEDLTIDAFDTLVIEPNVRLIVEGDIVNNGTIFIKATDTLTYGQLKWTGTYSGTGTVQVEKYLSSGWNMLAAGMQSSTTAYFGAVANNTNQNLANLYTWGGTEFVKTFSGDAISNSKGYLAYVGADGVKSSAGVYTFSGSPINEMTPEALHDDTKKANESTVTMYGGSLQSRYGWNLLPNPFLSDLRIGNLNRANINATYYIRTTKGGYRAVAPAGIEPDKVPPLSSYWVQANGANPSIQSGNSGKVSLPALSSAVFAPSTVGTPRLMRDPSELDQRVWNKAFVQVTGEVSGRGERHSIIERGFVYSLSPNPALGEVGTFQMVASSAGLGTFQMTIPDLNVNSVYYVRPYATSPSGTSYGSTITTLTPQTYTCGSNVAFTYNGSPETYTTYWMSDTKECWMSRNLGASGIASQLKGSGAGWNTLYNAGTQASDPSGGHYFQWGRKADGHQLANSATSTTKLASETSTSSSFVTSGSSWTTSAVTAVWNGVNASNNPCPNGWRIPHYSEWISEISTWNQRTLDPRPSWGGNTTTGTGSHSGLNVADPNTGFNRLKIRMSTFREAQSGKFVGRSDDDDPGYWAMSWYWSGTPGYGIYLSERWLGKSNTDFSLVGIHAHAEGGFVRCILSDGYITSTNQVD
jgi:hypothetical protein